MPMPAPTCGLERDRGERPERRRRATVIPAIATNRPPAEAFIRTAVTRPTISPIKPTRITPTTSGRTPGSTGTASCSPMYAYSWLRRLEAEDDPDDDADEDRHGEGADDPTRRDAEREEDRGDRQRQEELDAVEDAPADRAEDRLADEQRDSDDREEDREHDEHEGRETGRGNATDLARDRGGLGLGQVDVGDDERHRRVPDGADLGAQARRWAARPARRRRRLPVRAAVCPAVACPAGRRLLLRGPRSDRPGLVLPDAAVDGGRGDDTSASAPSSHAPGTLRCPRCQQPSRAASSPPSS